MIARLFKEQKMQLQYLIYTESEPEPIAIVFPFGEVALKNCLIDNKDAVALSNMIHLCINQLLSNEPKKTIEI